MTPPLPTPNIPAGFLRTWCDTLADGSESPPEAFLPTGLALLSAIAGPRLIMRWGVAHEERCNLWILNVGASALARKTSGLSGLRAAAKWAATGDELRLLNVARISDAGLVNSLDVVGPDTLKAAADTPPGEPDAEPHIRPVPVSWIAVFNEIAPIWMEDGPGWAMDAQRTMLAIYDGHLGSTTRATTVPHQETFVTAIGNIPPGVLREHTTLGMLSSGFVGRWVAVPTPAPDKIVAFPMPNGNDPLQTLEHDVRHIAHISRRTRYVVNDLWADDAIHLRDQWYRQTRAQLETLNPDDAYAAARAELWGRQQATAIKIATIVAVSTQAAHVDDLADIRVTCDEAAWAHNLIDASINYMLEALEEAGADARTPRGKTEGRVLRHLERVDARTAQTGRTYRQITNACKGGGTARQDVLAAIDALFASGHIEVNADQVVWLATDAGENHADAA